jgi:hypothetical protein
MRCADKDGYADGGGRNFMDLFLAFLLITLSIIQVWDDFKKYPQKNPNFNNIQIYDQKPENKFQHINF